MSVLKCYEVLGDVDGRRMLFNVKSSQSLELFRDVPNSSKASDGDAALALRHLPSYTHHQIEVAVSLLLDVWGCV